MPDEINHLIVTGGTGGLGSAISDAFRKSGWLVESPGKRELNVSNQSAVTEYFKNRNVDLLVCAAGVTNDVPIARMTESVWDQMWDVNFEGARSCAEAALTTMLKNGKGHIVFISSHSAMHPSTGQAAYSAAKAGLLGLTSDLATEHGNRGIRVNVILPGFLETPMTAKVTETRRNEVLASHVLGHLNTSKQVAAFIRFLHHSLPHTSGQVFQLDSRTRIL